MTLEKIKSLEKIIDFYAKKRKSPQIIELIWETATKIVGLYLEHLPERAHAESGKYIMEVVLRSCINNPPTALRSNL
jgi:hypothetical protein